MKSLAGKRVLVTGAARGIGFEIARKLGADDAEIVLTDLDEDGLANAKSELGSANVEASAYPLDVTDTQAIARIRDRIHEDTGPINILVNNAGIVFGGAFLDVPVEKHLLTQKVNTNGLIAMTHAFLPDLIAADEGHLVNIASASGLIGLPWGASYAASKWAVIGFSESLRLELDRLGHQNVSVTSVCPSYVSTGMFDGAKAPLLTPFLTPETIAAKTKKAILEEQVLVLEPWLVKLTPFLNGVLPRFATDRLADLFGASSSMKDWKGHGGA